MWIRDFLPKQIPNARIMTYGYESSPKSRSQLGIRENAEGLFEGLKVKRFKVNSCYPNFFVLAPNLEHRWKNDL